MILLRDTQETNQECGETLSTESSGGRACRYETSRIWETAGFMPPVVCRTVVEVLHLRGMEEGTERDIFPLLARDLLLQAGEIRDGCVITDPVQLRETAREWDVPVAGMSDQEIASLLTLTIIADYCIQP
ncbi:hypothetical protein [Methanofollis ethanolicus]|uniref:hypothetical protein n=1 Tax=Methanofollis ethanolicus TaxID=488124 RepID=UPI00082EFCDC|nr:hypothetical protein [Methanofollis ethanolicus]